MRHIFLLFIPDTLSLKMFLLFSVLFLLAMGSQGSEPNRKPQCSKMSEIIACPLNLAPVCGTDGITYANECGLCVQRLKSKSDILISKDGNC